VTAKTKIDMNVIESVAFDELAGTGLQFAVVVWRPGFNERGEVVAVTSRNKDLREVADALLLAADQMTDRMKEEQA
jgi:hypothetical protein